MPANDPEQQIEADADELEERIGKLDDHIGKAKQAADDRPGENPTLANGDGGDDDEPDDDSFDDPEAEEEDEDE